MNVSETDKNLAAMHAKYLREKLEQMSRLLSSSSREEIIVAKSGQASIDRHVDLYERRLLKAYASRFPS